MRAFWAGNLRIGVVSIPVGIAPVKKTQSTSLVRLHRGCGAVIEGMAWCPAEEKSVPDEEIVKAYEVERGEYVALEPDELATIEPAEEKTITVVATISRELLDDLQVSDSYYLVPSRTRVGRKPYVLFEQILREHPDLVLLCRTVVRKHEWVAIVRPHRRRRVLLLEKLVPEGGIVDVAELETELAAIELTDEERVLGREVILKRFRSKLPKGALKVEQRERLLELVESKMAGETIAAPEPERAQPEPRATPPGDLAELLRRSLSSTGNKKPRARRAPVQR